jgi:hypothetical protein
MIASPNRLIAGLSFVASVILAWLIVTNYDLMNQFVGTYSLNVDINSMNIGIIRDASMDPTFVQFSTIIKHVSAVISIVMAICAITFLLLIQIKNAFSFLRYQGEFDDALRTTVINLALSFVMILLASGIMAALSNPSLLWPSIHDDSNPLYYVIWLIKRVLYQTLPLPAFEP